MCVASVYYLLHMTVQWHAILLIFIGEVDSAKSMLSHCLEQDSTFSDAHLLMAQVQSVITVKGIKC